MVRLVAEPVEEKELQPVRAEMKKEMDPATSSNTNRAGTHSAFSCPDCGGVLWELQDAELLRFRCRVGHAFSARGVLDAQSEQLEAALWTALKALEEQANLAKQLASRAQARGHEQAAKNFEERKQHAEQRALLIQQLLQKNEPVIQESTITED